MTRANDRALFEMWARRCDDALAILDASGIIIDWNASADVLLPVTDADPRPRLGRPIAELLHEAGAVDSDEIIARLWDPELREVEVTLRSPAGAPRHLALCTACWEVDDHRYIGLRIEDRSVLRASEEELTQLASFPELDPNPIIELDLEGTITYMNAAAEVMGDELRTSVLRELHLRLCDEPANESRFACELCCGDAWYELRVHRIAEWSTIRIYAQDIRERKLAEAAIAESMALLEERVDQRTQALAETNQRLEREIEERRRAEKEAREASRVKSVFLATMSHELRTPLNAIIGYAELLLDDLPEENRDIGSILSSAKHLLALINNVLDISKIEAGKAEIFPESFALTQLLDDVARTGEGLVNPTTRLIRSWDPAALGLVFTDLIKLRQVLLNLLSNAAKFTEGGTITLGAVRHDEPPRIELRIEDSGIGIDEEGLRRIFEPFAQAERSTTRRFGGTGLGLAICAEYVRLIGGTLSVDSAVGVGTAFTVTVPLIPLGAADESPTGSPGAAEPAS